MRLNAASYRPEQTWQLLLLSKTLFFLFQLPSLSLTLSLFFFLFFFKDLKKKKIVFFGFGALRACTLIAGKLYERFSSKIIS